MAKKSLIGIGEKVITTISFVKEQLNILDLIALRYQVTRSGMISKLIMLHSDIDVNIREIVEHLIGDYAQTNMPFDDYVSAAEVWLEQKNISTYHRERIIEELRKNYETN